MLLGVKQTRNITSTVTMRIIAFLFFLSLLASVTDLLRVRKVSRYDTIHTTQGTTYPTVPMVRKYPIGNCVWVERVTSWQGVILRLLTLTVWSYR